MDDSFNFYISPGRLDMPDLSSSPQAISIARTDGETLTPDPARAQVRVIQEHPPVNRMEGDLGAICEVYRQSSNYFISIAGTRLDVGDVLSLRYADKPGAVIVKVVELENGRVRVDPPVYDPNG